MSKTFGWMLTTRFDNDLGVLADPKYGLSVSFIRPYYHESTASPEEDDGDDPGVEITSRDAFELFGKELLFPWEMSIVGWRIYDNRGESNQPEKEFGGVHGIESSQAVEVRDTIAKDIYALTGAQDATSTVTNAFSTLADDAERPTHKSLVHTLAPLSQLIAPLSNGILNFGRVMHAAEPAFDGNELRWVTFPS